MNESKTPGDLLRDLVAQISKSGPVDDHGHKLVMNRAYIKAVEWLDGKDATARPVKLDGLEAILAGVEAEQRAIPSHPANDPPAGVSRLGQAAIDAGYAEDPVEPVAQFECERCCLPPNEHTATHWCENRSFAAPPAAQPDAKDAAYMNIRAERERQDEQWGGPEHDDEHDPWDWARLIEHQTAWDREQDPWCRFVKIAALAVAAIESIERKKK